MKKKFFFLATICYALLRAVLNSCQLFCLWLFIVLPSGVLVLHNRRRNIVPLLYLLILLFVCRFVLHSCALFSFLNHSLYVGRVNRCCACAKHNRFVTIHCNSIIKDHKFRPSVVCHFFAYYATFGDLFFHIYFFLC